MSCLLDSQERFYDICILVISNETSIPQSREEGKDIASKGKSDAKMLRYEGEKHVCNRVRTLEGWRDGCTGEYQGVKVEARFKLNLEMCQALLARQQILTAGQLKVQKGIWKDTPGF